MGVFSPPSVASPLGWRIELALWSGYRGHSAARSFVEKSRCKKKKKSASYAGSVGRSAIIFLLFGRGSSGGLGLFLLPGGLPLGLGAGCACFIGFF